MAAVASTAHSAVMLSNLQLGYGRHLWDIPAATLSALHARRLSSTSIVCPIVICLVKISILLLYLRIFGSNRQVHHAVYIGICVCGLFYSAIFGINLGFVINCTTPNVMCDTAYPLDVFQSVFSTCTDLYVFLVPIPHVVTLQLTRRQEIGLLFIFVASLMACLVAISRLMVISFNFSSADRFWNAALVAELTYTPILCAIHLHTDVV
jgi:hypothetical protein